MAPGALSNSLARRAELRVRPNPHRGHPTPLIAGLDRHWCHWRGRVAGSHWCLKSHEKLILIQELA
ncbi:hypothetical protein SAMD00023353_6000310 [Rosellinia necatrix]|uniref:Uncharacterized protein n=1 Tax=Rosellinia necatrix TaxID=77044 RepID=A0A1S8AA67_ROSNE|nr:hypothetical protein SAMD00023353_6000310 [Rosellinia necatrix]